MTEVNSIGPAGKILMGNINRARTAQRLTYVELADRLAKGGRVIPVLGLRRIERGERRVDADDLIALAAAFGMTPSALLPGFDAPHGQCPNYCPNCGVKLKGGAEQ